MRAALFLVVPVLVVSALLTSNSNTRIISTSSPFRVREKRGLLNLEYKCSSSVLYTINYIEKVRTKVCELTKRRTNNLYHGNYPKKFIDPIEGLKFRAFGDLYYYFPLLENGKIYTNAWAKFHTGSYIVIEPKNCLVATVYQKRKVLPQVASRANDCSAEKCLKSRSMFTKTPCQHLNAQGPFSPPTLQPSNIGTGSSEKPNSVLKRPPGPLSFFGLDRSRTYPTQD